MTAIKIKSERLEQDSPPSMPRSTDKRKEKIPSREEINESIRKFNDAVIDLYNKCKKERPLYNSQLQPIANRSVTNEDYQSLEVRCKGCKSYTFVGYIPIDSGQNFVIETGYSGNNLSTQYIQQALQRLSTKLQDSGLRTKIKEYVYLDFKSGTTAIRLFLSTIEELPSASESLKDYVMGGYRYQDGTKTFRVTSDGHRELIGRLTREKSIDADVGKKQRNLLMEFKKEYYTAHPDRFIESN